MIDVRFHSEAEQDLAESARYYEQRRYGLGTRFVASVEQAVEVLREHPNAGVQVDRIHLQISVPRFPFTVIYRIAQDLVVVIAVAHRRRRPGYWRYRD
ncbi:MAG TPA: type II toxin-antitoxin system RelE/ParE family toxin [Chloroflexota bacterium]|nr:type II toxin-antitoxin system RelE/ParE family toxin [Chloroflexota bacterium]